MPATLLAVALVFSFPVSPAWADTPDTARHGVDVPAGTLEDALNAFARQAGITLSYDPLLVRGLNASALAGQLTVAEGLAGLLAAHQLEAVRSQSGAYLVQPSKALPPGEHPQLPAVVVAAPPEQADGPVDGYVARRSATASKTDTPVIETPRSVSVVTRDQMDDQAVQTVEQSLRYSAGVLTEVAGHDLRFSATTVRGFAPGEFIDGFKLPASTDYTGWLPEPQGLERVELVKGPSATVYDQSAPGGVINMISKRPTAEMVREVSVAMGNQDRYQGAFDLGGPLNADGTLQYRLNGLLRNSGSQTDFGRDDRSFIAPALTWKPTSRTTVTLLAEATRDRTTPKSAWPPYALLVPNPNGRIPVNRFIGEPDLDHYDRNTYSFTALVSHRLNDQWTLRENLRLAALDLDYFQVAGIGFRNDLRTLDRRSYAGRDKVRTASIDNQLEGRFRTGALSHILLLGMDYRSLTRKRASGERPAASIDAFAPAYGGTVAAGLDPPESFAIHGTTQQFGLYAQDQMHTGPWSVGVAVRRDQVRSGGFVTDPTQRASEDRKTTYNASVLYLTEGGLAPYASYSTSFTPVTDSGFGGVAFKPELGRQLEFGLKYQPPGMDALFTVSAFSLKKNNVTTIDPERAFFRTQTGEIRTRGPEFEARAALTRNLRMLASFTVLDAKVTSTTDPRELGKQPLQTARRTAALWLDYRFTTPELRGWSVGGGVRHVGKVPADTGNTFFNPAYTLVDAAIRYDQGSYSLALNATNLFDRRYVSGRGQFFGQGRALQAKLTYRW